MAIGRRTGGGPLPMAVPNGCAGPAPDAKWPHARPSAGLRCCPVSADDTACFSLHPMPESAPLFMGGHLLPMARWRCPLSAGAIRFAANVQNTDFRPFRRAP